jgi:hypothetical protein
MPTGFQAYAPDQDILLPQSLQAWLSAGYLARCISDTIYALDLSAFFKRHEGGGPRNRPFHPTMTPARKKPGRAFKRAFGEPAPKAQDNFTDPDSRIMKTSAGFEPCFNAQTGVDNHTLAHAQIIVATELTNCGADSGELPRMLEVVEHNTGRAPEMALTDAGYRREAVPDKLSSSPTEPLFALGREGKRQIAIDAERLPHTVAMAAKLQSAQGSAKHRSRKGIVEPPNGWIKQVLGSRQFSMRGLDKARCEFKPVCAALNLRRMATMVM